MISVKCGQCNRQAEVPDQWEGRQVKCKCGARLAVKSPEMPPQGEQTASVGPRIAQQEAITRADLAAKLARKLAIGAVGLVVVAVLIAAVSRLGAKRANLTPEPTAEAPKQPTEPIGKAINPFEMWDTYQQNAARAAQEYTGQRFSLVCLVDGVHSDIRGDYVSCKGDVGEGTFRLYFRPNAHIERLNPGDVIGFDGIPEGSLLGIVLIGDCRALRKWKSLDELKAELAADRQAKK